jgi:hypothetical protein
MVRLRLIRLYASKDSSISKRDSLLFGSATIATKKWLSPVCMLIFTEKWQKLIPKNLDPNIEGIRFYALFQYSIRSNRKRLPARR